jgi:hypothetical protein
MSRPDILGTTDIDETRGVVKDIEVWVAKGRFIFLQRRARVHFDGRKDILLTLIGKSFHPFLAVDDDELPGLAIPRARGQTAIPNNLLYAFQGDPFFLEVPDRASFYQ